MHFLCKKFENVKTNFTYEPNNKNYKIKNDDDFKKYCTNNNCVTEIDKINAGCLYLFDAFFGNSSSFKDLANSNINIVDYIMLWLSYILSLKNNEYKNSLKYFYSASINSDEKYKKAIDYIQGNSNYKDLIVNKHDLTNDDIDSNIIANLYDAFNKLCDIYTEFNENSPNCDKCLTKANEFANKYEALNKDSNNTYGSSYNKILYTLSTDYNKLKDKCSNIPSITEIATNSYAQMSGYASSSSIANKLFIVLSIFGAIAIFLGISYKRKNKKYKEENESLIYYSKSSDYSMNSNNSDIF
ncbi:hypothetical protein, variant [Plasmodium yoelii 17X]|uniref:Uncharacterized protein n=1 Tax=Plasmodium yoelii 17X TaxID=1323249 RepID=V7PCG9_PLAYE|nr:hypothetical protein, variant [Plasmodium yoelii 17X]